MRSRWDDEEGDDDKATRRVDPQFVAPRTEEGRGKHDTFPDQDQEGRKGASRHDRSFEDQLAWGNGPAEEATTDQNLAVTEKEKPNFEVSGKLAEDTNMVNGVLVKYSEPPEARKPKLHWRLYPFKNDEALPVIHIHRQSAFLLGRERKVSQRYRVKGSLVWTLLLTFW